MPTYIAHVDVDEMEYQNPQEFVSIWGSIREDVQQVGGEIEDTHAVLGPYDFDVRFHVDGDEEAFRVTQLIERHGLDTETYQTLPIERLGEIVDDL